MLALIPARSGSVRVPNKNILPINGHPLIAYAIQSALNAEIFDRVVVCTDSPLYADIARYYGAYVPALRSKDISGSKSPDRDWINWLFSVDPSLQDHSYAFILRPTNPFRTSATIKRAWSEFKLGTFDTLRAVRPTTEHPGKMWMLQGKSIIPLLPFCQDGVPWHSNQTSALFDVFVQDASLEIFTISNFISQCCITGTSILPFFATGSEGFDLNTPQDLTVLLNMLQSFDGTLEKILQDPWPTK